MSIMSMCLVMCMCVYICDYKNLENDAIYVLFSVHNKNKLSFMSSLRTIRCIHYPHIVVCVSSVRTNGGLMSANVIITAIFGMHCG